MDQGEFARMERSITTNNGVTFGLQFIRSPSDVGNVDSV